MGLILGVKNDVGSSVVSDQRTDRKVEMEDEE